MLPEELPRFVPKNPGLTSLHSSPNFDLMSLEASDF